MHISVPDCEELTESKGGRGGQPLKYVSYNVHVNGTYHCSSRFSQLGQLHEKLKREFGQGCLEKFPGKQFFYLKAEQCTERRWGLQRWLQKIAQQPVIVQGETFQQFLLNAQKEVQRGPEEDVNLEIYLCNGKSVKVDIVSTDQTDDVLETVGSVLGVAPHLTYYFGLYLVDDAEGKVVIRKLQHFESPYISLMRAEPHQSIQLRKAYWDLSLDKLLRADATALNLLYIEAIASIRNGYVKVSADKEDEMQLHRSNKNRTKFLDIAEKSSGFGYTTFEECTISYPERSTGATVRLGHSMFNVTLATGKEHLFAVHRMRCWRTYTVEEGIEMEFEYFFDTEDGEGKMKWVKVLSPQTIHMAMCLQLMVEEMVRLKAGKPVKTPDDRVGKFKPRRQTQQKADLSFLSTGSAADEVPRDEGDDGVAKAKPAKQKVSVTLSDLMAKVNTDADEDEDEPIDFNSLTHKSVADEPKRNADDDDDDDYSDDDDPRNAFASLAGL